MRIAFKEAVNPYRSLMCEKCGLVLVVSLFLYDGCDIRAGKGDFG